MTQSIAITTDPATAPALPTAIERTVNGETLNTAHWNLTGQADAQAFSHLASHLYSMSGTPFAIGAVNTTSDTIDASGHTLGNTDAIRFTATMGTLCPELVPGTIYYARDVVAGVSLKVAATPGGSAIDLTGSPSGATYVWKVPSGVVVNIGISDDDITWTGLHTFTQATSMQEVECTTLNASGPVTLDDTLDVNGSSVLAGVTCTTLGASGASALAAVSCTTVAASSNATVGGTLGVTGGVTCTTLGASGNATVGGTLGVTSNATVGGTLGVTGAAQFLSVSGTGLTFDVTSDATIDGSLDVSLGLDVGLNATVHGDLTVGPDLSSNPSDLTVTGEVFCARVALGYQDLGAADANQTLVADKAVFRVTQPTTDVTRNIALPTPASGNPVIEIRFDGVIDASRSVYLVAPADVAANPPSDYYGLWLGAQSGPGWYRLVWEGARWRLVSHGGTVTATGGGALA